MNKVEVAVRCFVCGDIVSSNLDVPAGRLLGPCHVNVGREHVPMAPLLRTATREGRATDANFPTAPPGSDAERVEVPERHGIEQCGEAVETPSGSEARLSSRYPLSEETLMARSPGHASSSCRDAATAAALRLPKFGQRVGPPETPGSASRTTAASGDRGFSGAHWDSDVVYRLPQTRRLSADRRTTPSAPSNGRWASATARHTPSLRAALSLANSPHIGSATSWT